MVNLNFVGNFISGSLQILNRGARWRYEWKIHEADPQNKCSESFIGEEVQFCRQVFAILCKKCVDLCKILRGRSLADWVYISLGLAWSYHSVIQLKFNEFTAWRMQKFSFVSYLSLAIVRLCIICRVIRILCPFIEGPKWGQ